MGGWRKLVWGRDIAASPGASVELLLVPPLLLASPLIGGGQFWCGGLGRVAGVVESAPSPAASSAAAALLPLVACIVPLSPLLLRGRGWPPLLRLTCLDWGGEGGY